jgi:hypothetical protein
MLVIEVAVGAGVDSQERFEGVEIIREVQYFRRVCEMPLVPKS